MRSDPEKRIQNAPAGGFPLEYSQGDFFLLDKKINQVYIEDVNRTERRCRDSGE
jgi:hypothetical protein